MNTFKKKQAHLQSPAMYMKHPVHSHKYPDDPSPSGYGTICYMIFTWLLIQ